MKPIDRYARMPLDVLRKKEWSSRVRGKLFACPSCGGRWYTHCDGCLLLRALKAREAESACVESEKVAGSPS